MLTATAPTAEAAELAWDGHYRARGAYFNSLSMSDTNSRAEGAALTWDHRARLAPGLLLSDKVSIHTQVDLLPYVLWGDQVDDIDPVTGDDIAVSSAQAVGPPTTDDGAATLQNVQVTRLWAEVYTGIGRFQFGRVPVEWGTGMVFNAGNDPEDEFGDTADRVLWTGEVGPVFLFGGFESPYEGFVGETDDVKALTGGILYQTETAALGMYNTFRWREYDDDRFGAWIGDIYAGAEVGPVQLQTEFAAIIGSGDLSTGANDVTISSFGWHLEGALETDGLRGGLGLGLAGGDEDPDDSAIHTFAFDPDFNVALLMFEEPMPTLETQVKNDSNGGREYDAVRTGYSLSNALYLNPRIGYRLNDKLYGDLSLFAARAAKVPTDEEDDRGYGTEFDLNVRYTPFPHFFLHGTAGVLFPGNHYRNYEDDTLGGGFDQPVFGAQLLGTVHF